MTYFYKKQIGFSLIELVVVCLLIGILVGIGVPSYMNSKYKADKQKGIFNLYAIHQAEKLYYFDREPPAYSSNLDELTPSYAEFSLDDGTWLYQIASYGGTTYSVRASHERSDGLIDGYWIAIDQTGTIDDASAHWPY